MSMEQICKKRPAPAVLHPSSVSLYLSYDPDSASFDAVPVAAAAAGAAASANAAAAAAEAAGFDAVLLKE